MIADVRTASPQQWDDLAARCAWTTFFETRAWAELWARALPDRFRPAPELYTLADGTEVVVPLSRLRALRGLASRAVATPGGHSGAFLCARELAPGESRAVLDALRRRHENLAWRSSALAPPVDGGRDAREVVTRLASLRDMPALRRRWRKSGARYEAERALRAGLVAARADDADSRARYLDLVRADADRRSFGPPLAVVRALLEAGLDGVQLWLARDAAGVTAGAVCLRHGRHVSYWHGASDRGRRVRGAELLLRTVAEREAEAGAEVLDLLPSGGLDGVEWFKRKLGGDPVRYPAVRQDARWVRALERVRRSAKVIAAGIRTRPSARGAR